MARAKRFLSFAAKLYFLIWMAAQLAACRIVDPLAGLRGDIAAHRDLAQGQVRVLQWGLLSTSPTIDEYERLLKSRYGIEFKTVAGCVATYDQAAYWDAYNAVMHEAISSKHGPGVFERTRADAERNTPNHKATVY